MDQAIRNKLRSVVTQCRRLLEESIAQQLQGRYDIYATGKKDEVRAEKDVPLDHLSDEKRQARQDILAHFEHVTALGYKPKEALEQLIREIAFTHLNRLCAYKMMEVRDVYVGGQRFREAVSKGLKSQGFLFYLADHPDDERRFNAGQQEEAYRHFLNWLGGSLSQEIGVLFSPTDPANRVYPPQRVLDEVLDLLNSEELRGIWSEDETIGWVYQYFTPKELRDQARKESQAPRNSYELAFRNQFFTPRYVVEFLTDNTLGRIWYEMRRGNTRLKDECRYMVRRPSEVFLRWDFGDLDDEPPFWDAVTRADFGALPETATWNEINPFALLINGYEEAERHGLGDCGEFANARLEAYRETGEWKGNALELWCCLFFEQRRWRHFGHEPQGEDFGAILALYQALRRALTSTSDGLGQDELLKRPAFIPIRPTKDPREIKILDPACGSGHFLLYCFALLLVIYEEAYDDPDLGPGLQAEYPSKEDLRRAIPSLILRHNLHGIDIDLRCTQIAALALWLRCQRAYQEMGLKKDRPPILKANVVCAEPMPGEEGLFDEFLKTLREDLLEALIRQVMNVPKDQRVRATRGMVESLSDLVRTVWDRMRLAGEAGSLLKVEDELQDAIRRGQEQWEERLPLFRFTEYGLSEEPKERLVRFVPGDVEGDRVTFWDKAETLVRRALDEFISFASNGGRFQRQLFVEDAEQGLGFVDVCRRRFDVVLMNPPFGAVSKPSKTYVEEAYPRTKNDLYGAFVERGLGLLVPAGMLGAITSRSGFFLRTFKKWREEILLRHAEPVAFADLGQGVLDTAMVETAAYTLSKGRQCRANSLFIRLMEESEKGSTLAGTLESISAGRPCGSMVFAVDTSSFMRVPGSPFAYWVGERIRNLFTSLPSLESGDRAVQKGAYTNDDFRFVRAWWEVCPSSCARSREETINGEGRWVTFAKGGAYSPYYGEWSLMLDWENDGESLKSFLSDYRGKRGWGYQWSAALNGYTYYFKPGLTWSRRSQRGLSVRVLPQGCIIGDKGPCVFTQSTDSDKAWPLLGLMNSRVFASLVRLQMAFGSYEVGVMERTPVPNQLDSSWRDLGDLSLNATQVKRNVYTGLENSHIFYVPGVVQLPGETLAETIANWQSKVSVVEQSLSTIQREIDGICYSLYGIDEHDQGMTDVRGDEGEAHAGDNDEPDAEDDSAESTSLYDPRGLVAELPSYALGCVFGRWDVRLAIGPCEPLDLPDPFLPLPVSSPGMLQGPNGYPAVESPKGYPLCIDWDGILVDDPDHPDDILRRVRDVLEVIWEERADAIEKEACEILGVADLRDYFRRPGAGGFWDDHIKRYSKSRRKAPIYWLLQSSKKNYALWVYHHRLDKDILFKALLNYVEPKIRKEEARLGELRSQKAALGPAAKGAKKLDKDIDRQEAFLSELRDFEDKLRRAANLHLDPDLNDGVVLNIAPLHELVPWKEAKSYWDDLMDGKYEWSSIAKQLREKGLVSSQPP